MEVEPTARTIQAAGPDARYTRGSRGWHFDPTGRNR